MVACKFVPFLLLAVFIVFCNAKVDPSLRKRLASGETSDVLITFLGSNSEIVQQIQNSRFQSQRSKVKALTSGLKKLSEASQMPVLRHLQNFGVQAESFWGGNQMVIKDANLFHVESIEAFPSIARIQTLPVVELSPVSNTNTAVINAANPAAIYGIQKIQADKAWAEFGTQGEGVVVANIDTGVRGTHEALAGNFRQDHGWFDPINGEQAPYDNNGHGTHTMGTIAGNVTGVAPGATWIACKGCGDSSCNGISLLACGEWMLSPTNPDGSNPDPEKIPDVVSNSWGGALGNDDWYNATIDAWKAAGILHAFAIGNSGPLCRSGGSPGDQLTTFSVGSTDSNDRLSIFSSKGPAGAMLTQKPDISAPGSNVYSTWNTSDTAYNTISGTSMATPHVAGTIALMVAAKRLATKNPNATLSFANAVTIIQKTADTQNLTVPLPNFRCDGILIGSGTFPNNQFGHGRINALKAVNATINGVPETSRFGDFNQSLLPNFF